MEGWNVWGCFSGFFHRKWPVFWIARPKIKSEVEFPGKIGTKSKITSELVTWVGFRPKLASPLFQRRKCPFYEWKNTKIRAISWLWTIFCQKKQKPGNIFQCFDFTMSIVNFAYILAGLTTFSPFNISSILAWNTCGKYIKQEK